MPKWNKGKENQEECGAMKECFLTEDELKKEREKIGPKMTTELLNNSDYEMVPVKYISKYGAEIIQYERKDGIPDYHLGKVVRIDSAVTKTYL